MRNILPWLLRYLLCDYNVFLIWFSIFLSSSNMVIYLGLFFLCADFYTLAYYSVLKLFPVVVQSSSHVWLFATPWTATRQASLSPTISQSLPKFMSIASVMPSSHLILWRPLLLCPQSFPASGTSPMSQLFQSDDQNTGASAPASVLPISIQGLFPLKLTGLILLSKGLWSVFSSTTVWRHYFYCASLSLLSSSQTIHDPWEDYSLDYTDVCWQSNVSAFQHTV